MFSRVHFYGDSLLNNFFTEALENAFAYEAELVYPRKKDDTYLYEVDLPGVKKEDIEIKIEKNLCTITARRKRKSETLNISRYFYLPKHVDKEGISATMTDGVLTLTVKEKIPEGEKPMIVKIE